MRGLSAAAAELEHLRGAVGARRSRHWRCTACCAAEFVEYTSVLLETMTVRNHCQESQTYVGSNQKLKDAARRQFSTTQMAVEFNRRPEVAINPGNQTEVFAVFDVPPDTKPTQIVLHDSAYSPGVTVDLT